MALSIGFTRFVSSADATQVTGLLTFAPVGLSPTEHASLCWTHSFAKTSYASKGLILPLHGGKVHVVMLNAIVIAIRFVLLMLSGQRQVALETGA